MEPDSLRRCVGFSQMTMTVETMDVRDGGRWNYTQRTPDGTSYGFHGVFHGAPSPDHTVQTFEFDGAPGSVALNSLTLEERAGRTVLRIHSVYQSIPDRDAMVEGGMSHGLYEGYSRLDELVAGLVAAN